MNSYMTKQTVICTGYRQTAAHRWWALSLAFVSVNYVNLCKMEKSKTLFMQHSRCSLNYHTHEQQNYIDNAKLSQFIYKHILKQQIYKK